MTDSVGDEIGDLVAKAQESEDDAGEEAEKDSEPSKGAKVKKKRSTRKKPEKAKTLEEMDLEDMMPDSLPKAAQQIKSLGDMYARYGVGERPEFKVHLYRSYPKIAPGNIKFDGFYDEYNIPITEQMIQGDYGGGQYRVVVVGPNPKNPNLSKHYESFSVGLAGEPNFDRMPRALQTPDKASGGATNSNPAPIPVSSPQEHPKLAEAALKMISERAKEDRDELRRREEVMERRITTAGGGGDAVADAERRRADDLIRSERERAEEQRRYMKQRMEEMRREQEERERRNEMEARSKPSFGEELRALAPLLQRNDDGAAKEMFSQILQKHRDEVSSIQTNHAEFIRDIRTGHRDEMAALRQAHQREIEAERQASRSREERIEERLRAERDERERDRVRHKEAMDERDRHWKDRVESQIQMQNSSWEARHQAQISTYESRIQWLQQEIDKLKSENYEMKQKQEDKGDVFSQLTRHQELARMMKGFAGQQEGSSSTSSGGIGLSGGADDWKATLAEGLTERAPAILEKFFSPGGAAAQVQQPQPQQMQQFHEGQVVDTPQGKMEVVRNPQDGQLALAPKEALDRHREAIAKQSEGGGLLGGATQQPQPKREQSSRRPQPKREPSISAVPHLGEGLPRRRPPWEGGGSDDGPPPPPEPPPPMPRSASRKPESTSGTEPMEMTSTERQGLQLVAKEVHESVSRADEPEEFVAKMVDKYPANVLQQIVGLYSDRQVVRGIAQLQPNSAGATPAGRTFVARAFHLLREAVSQ